jgi:hypothetical protein
LERKPLLNFFIFQIMSVQMRRRKENNLETASVRNCNLLDRR